MDSPYRRELEVAIAAVEQAAQISQKVLADADKGTVEKEDNLGPVTVGDFAIQALLTAALHAAFPDDGFVGEEDASALRADAALCERVYGLAAAGAKELGEGNVAQVLSSKEAMCTLIDRCAGVPTKGRVWVFDPIDGTRTFVRREMYAINVCLLVDGVQTVAVVAVPLMALEPTNTEEQFVTNNSIDPTGHGVLLFAVRGNGTYARRLVGEDKTKPSLRRLPQVSHAALCPVTCYAMQQSARDDVHRAVAAALDVPFPGNDLLGWVPRWASLALGRGGANFTVWVYQTRRKYAKIWDHAGAMLLFLEVGGRITDVDGKELDLLAGRQLTNNYGFVAATAAAHGRVLAAVQKVVQEEGL